MSDDNSTKVKCPNGHEQPVTGTRFCIFCGTAILSAQPLANIPQQQPVINQQELVKQQNAPYSVPPVQQQTPPYQNPVPQNYPQNYQQPPVIGYVPQVNVCRSCGGAGQNLASDKVICGECRWLRPLVPGYRVDSSAFAWAADAKAMAALRAVKPLNAAAKAVSEKVGRRWIEVTFNGIRLGEKQMPHIFGQAVRAARILGMEYMPDIYISGERPWDMLTFGSERDSFIVIGSAMAGNFQGIDMFFLLARELGHCKAGHALWKTVIRFFLGEQGNTKGFMAGGIFNAILSPSALIGGAIEMPLLAWARQAEITADRAGLLAVGSEDVARRVLLSWSLKSSFLFKDLNIESWIAQQADDDGDILRLSELTVTSTPYIGPRLKLLNQYAQSPELQSYVKVIGETLKKAAPPKPKNQDPEMLRIKCSSCKTNMRIPVKILEGKAELSVKCADAKCGAVTRLTKKANNNNRQLNQQERMTYGD